MRMLIARHDKWVSKCTTLDLPCLPCTVTVARTRRRLVEKPGHAQKGIRQGQWPQEAMSIHSESFQRRHALAMSQGPRGQRTCDRTMGTGKAIISNPCMQESSLSVRLVTGESPRESQDPCRNNVPSNYRTLAVVGEETSGRLQWRRQSSSCAQVALHYCIIGREISRVMPLLDAAVYENKIAWRWVTCR